MKRLKSSVYRTGKAIYGASLVMHERILVVDDDKEIAQMIKDILEIKHYRVFIASDGLKAIELSNRERMDLILLDIRMPMFSGYWFCDAFRQKPSTRMVPVIVISALSGKEDIEKAYRVGASAYLKKPFSAEELLGLVGKCCASN